MRGFSGGAEDWKMSCIVHHFTGISDFQDIGSNITAVIVFNVPVVEFQYQKKKIYDCQPGKCASLLLTRLTVLAPMLSSANDKVSRCRRWQVPAKKIYYKQEPMQIHAWKC